MKKITKTLLLFSMLSIAFGIVGCKKSSTQTTSQSDSSIEEVDPSSLSFDEKVFTLAEGETVELQAKVGPANARNDYVISYSSSNVAVAVIDSQNVLTAVKEGESTITARIEKYDLSASMLLRVYRNKTDFVALDDEHQYDQTAPKKFPTFTDDPNQVDEANGVYGYCNCLNPSLTLDMIHHLHVIHIRVQ